MVYYLGAAALITVYIYESKATCRRGPLPARRIVLNLPFRPGDTLAAIHGTPGPQAGRPPAPPEPGRDIARRAVQPKMGLRPRVAPHVTGPADSVPRGEGAGRSGPALAERMHAAGANLQQDPRRDSTGGRAPARRE